MQLVEGQNFELSDRTVSIMNALIQLLIALLKFLW